MDTNHIIALAVPLILIMAGVFVKISPNPEFDTLRRSWLWFILPGLFLLVFRLFKYFG